MTEDEHAAMDAAHKAAREAWDDDPAKTEAPICTNCGDDLAAEGETWCLACLERDASTRADERANYEPDKAKWLTDEEAEAEHRRRLAEERPTDPAPDLPEPTYGEDEPLPSESQLHGEASTPGPLPELETEEAAPEAPASGTGPQLVGQGQLRAMQTLLSRELGSASTPEERHAMLAAILGHPVESARLVTRYEAHDVFRTFDKFATGEAAWEFTEGGNTIRVFEP